MPEVKSAFVRCDDYNPSCKCDNPIQEKWIHKQIVKKTGDSEDDFIIEEKPVMIDRIDIQKQIQEEAKTSDLKYLLAKLLQENGVITGDEPELNVSPGFYGDVTTIQSALETGAPIPSVDSIRSSLPEELHALSVEQLASMSDQDILAYIAQVRSQVHEDSKAPSEASNSEEKEG